MNTRNFIIAGGSRGIGRSITDQLLDEGHHVTVLSRDKHGLRESDRLKFFSWDATTDEFPVDAADGIVDGLVYCPGSIVLKPFRSLSEQQFIDDLQINLLGAIKVIKACYTSLKKSDSQPGIVLFSTVAVQQGLPFHASIAASKGALEGLVRSLAAEWAPTIRVNAIAPSLTQTSLAEKLLSSPEKMEAAAQRHPLKSIGQPEDMARTACFLLSDAARWITGQIIHVDGGMSSVRV